MEAHYISHLGIRVVIFCSLFFSIPFALVSFRVSLLAFYSQQVTVEIYTHTHTQPTIVGVPVTCLFDCFATAEGELEFMCKHRQTSVRIGDGGHTALGNILDF